MPVMGYLHGDDDLPCCDQLQRAATSTSVGSGEPNGEPMPTEVRPQQAATSHSFRSYNTT